MSKHGKTYLVLLLLIAVLLVGKWKLGKKPDKEQLWNLSADKIARLQVTEEGKDKPLVLARKDGDWQIEQPLQALAAKDDAERMVKSLAELKFRTDYRDRPEVKYKEWGLDKPELIVAAWDRHGEQVAELKVGDETKLSGQLWALADGQLCTISSYIKSDFIKDPKDLREKKLARFEKADARSVRLQHGEIDILCEKTKDEDGEEDTWTMRRPVETKADDFEVDGVVSTIEGLEAKLFAADEEEKPEEGYGLAQPQLTATVTFEKGDPVVIKLGKRTWKQIEDPMATEPDDDEKDELIYAQREGRSEVVLIEYDKLSDLAKQVKMLRSKKIWSFDEDDVENIVVKRKSGLTFSLMRDEEDTWQILQPKKTAADNEFMNSLLWAYSDLRAEDFVEDSPKDLARFVLDPPVIEVTFELIEGKTKSLLIGKQTGLDYYAMEKGGRSVYSISEYKVDKLPATLAQVEKKEPTAGPAEEIELPPGGSEAGAGDSE